MRRACLLKKPLLRVEKDGYPLTSSLFAFALAHVTLPLPLAPPLMPRSGYIFLGDDRPLILSKLLVKPGLAQPPSALGEGERDNDISSGVAGIDGRGNVEPRAVSPDVAPLSEEAAEWLSSGGTSVFTLDERRRRCWSGGSRGLDGDAREASLFALFCSSSTFLPSFPAPRPHGLHKSRLFSQHSVADEERRKAL